MTHGRVNVRIVGGCIIARIPSIVELVYVRAYYAAAG